MLLNINCTQYAPSVELLMFSYLPALEFCWNTSYVCLVTSLNIYRVITPRWRATYDRLASEFPTNSSLAREARKTLAWSSYDPRKLLVNTRTHSQALANARHDVHEYMKLFHTLVKLLASGTSEVRSHVARKFLVSSSYANRDTRMFLVTLVYRSYITRTRLVVHLEGTCRIK